MNFTVPNFLKDLRLGAEAAKERKFEMPLNAIAQDLLQEATFRRCGGEDYAAASKVLVKQAAIQLAEQAE